MNKKVKEKEKETIMKNRKVKQMLLIAMMAIATVTSTVGSTLPVYAAGESRAAILYPTPNGVANMGMGSASITIQGNPGQSLVGKKFEVFKLFDCENAENGESVNYTFNSKYESSLKKVVGARLSKDPSKVTEYDVIDYIQTLNTNPVEGATADQTLEGSYSNFRYFVEALRNQIKEDVLDITAVDVSQVRNDNSIVIGGLSYGYYIVDEVTSVSDTHSAASLCMVNTANPTAAVNIKSDYPTVTKKILEDDDRSFGNNGWNDIADYEIGQTVPFKYISNIPNMNGYNTYYYAWHDKMDEALTFKPDSVTITINEGAKSYTLKDTEYKVITNPGDGETFKVEVDDIKAIVDRQFNHKNSLNENTYGQEVVVTYNATLNDKAAKDTGRPGFENDVRLEFSNNPDSNGAGDTGFTPWDTVVCFTYKLNGLKTNNHGAVLENAKFRLYSDKDCKNEVYVKKGDNGYIVINRDSIGGSDHTGGTKPANAVEMVSDKNGVFTIFGLDDGVYYLKETDSPAGYRELLDPIVITVESTFTDLRQQYVKGDGATDKTLKQLTATAHIKEFLDGVYKESDTNLETDVSDGAANITVINTVGKKLPVTGSSAVLVMVGSGTAMMMAALKKRKNGEEEE